MSHRCVAAADGADRGLERGLERGQERGLERGLDKVLERRLTGVSPQPMASSSRSTVSRCLV